MGLYDRDYIRADAPPRGGGPSIGSPRTWSVNAWLIAICVAVFVLEVFMPLQPIETGLYWAVDQQTGEWVELSDDPFRQGSIRNQRTTLGQELVALTIPAADGGQKVVQGFPVSLPDGEVIGLAEGTMASAISYWFHFSTKKVIGGAELWRLVGFQFLHANEYHLLFNMVGLFFFGPLVERYLGGKRYLAFYLLCGMFGALLYLVLNLGGYVLSEMMGVAAVPGLLFNATGTPLIGASAGVFGVLMAGAYLAPDVRVLLFFVIPMRLATLAWALVIISLLSVLWNLNNAGGEAAHLGGAAGGFYFIRHPQSLHGLFDFFGKVDPTSKHFAVRRGSPGGSSGGTTKVDRILDKISRKGLKSLTAREKKILEEASRRGSDRNH